MSVRAGPPAHAPRERFVHHRAHRRAGVLTERRRGLTSFTDDTLPRGAAGIQYLVVPQRGTLTGPTSQVYSVMLGVGPDGTMSLAAASAADADPASLRMVA